MKDRFLVLLRHGIAEDPGELPDDERRLTETGERRVRQIGKGLARILPGVEAIYASPLIRAAQTAEAIARAYPKGLRLKTLPELRPGANIDVLRDLLLKTNHQRFVAVGHEPVLSQAMQALTGTSCGLELKKGGCYGLRIGADGVRLEWLLPPRVLRRV